MKIVFFSMEGELWKGKLPNIPRVGEQILINNKVRFSRHTVLSVEHRIDQKNILIKLSDSREIIV